MIIRVSKKLHRLAWLLPLALAAFSAAYGQSTQESERLLFPKPALNSEKTTDPVEGTILTIFSYHPGMDWVDALLKGFEKGLGTLPNVEHYTEFLDTKRHPTIPHSEAFLTNLGDKYADQQPDVLMIADDPGFELLQHRITELFPDVPVIFFGLNNIREDVPASFTGIYEVHESKPTIDIALELTQASGVAVISATTATGVAHEHTLNAEIAAYPDVEWTIIRDVVSDDLSALQALPDDWPILTMEGLRQGSPNGAMVTYKKSVKILNAQLPNPLFWSTEFMLGSGIVGGYMLNVEMHAQHALDLAVQVLHGANPNDIPAITKTPHDWQFDWRELNRRGWLDRVPDSANLLYAQPSFMQKHRELLVPVGLAILALLNVIGILCWHLRAERRHAKRLKSETRRSATALLAADAGVFEIKADGTSVCSDRWLEMISAKGKPAHCPSTQWLDQLTDKSSAELEERFQLLRLGSERERLEIEMESPSRLVNLMLMREGDTPETVSIVGIGTDETSHRRVERQAASRARLHSLGQLAGGVAHDFNNLLMAILINAKMIPHATSDEQKNSLAESIVDVGDRAEALTQRLLTFGSAEEQREPPKNNLNQLVNDSHDLLKGLAKGCNISLQLHNDALTCALSPSSMDQILTNLVVNARDAMKGVGVIVIETTVSENEQGASLAVLRVRDTGIGMDSDTIERLFEPFFSTKVAEQGTGLGLSTVYGLVTSSGGMISVESKKGMGSTFEISWPLQKAELNVPESDPQANLVESA